MDKNITLQHFLNHLETSLTYHCKLLDIINNFVAQKKKKKLTFKRKPLLISLNFSIFSAVRPTNFFLDTWP